MTEVSLLLESIASILQAICWPALVVIILYFFRQPLGDFFANLSEFTFKASPSGLEASAKKFEAAANLAVASAKQDGDQEADISRPGNVARAVERLSDRQVLKLAGKHLLWVDDNPSNNIYERKALEALGIDTVISLTTDDALEKIRSRDFDVIVSDIARGDDMEAGFKLLEVLKERQNKVPFILYSSSASPEEKQDARRRGAYGRASIAEDLFHLVLNSLLISE